MCFDVLQYFLFLKKFWFGKFTVLKYNISFASCFRSYFYKMLHVIFIVKHSFILSLELHISMYSCYETLNDCVRVREFKYNIKIYF
jgi:hypothetical protein